MLDSPLALEAFRKRFNDHRLLGLNGKTFTVLGKDQPHLYDPDGDIELYEVAFRNGRVISAVAEQVLLAR